MLALIGSIERDWTRAAQKLAPFIRHDLAQESLRVAAIRGRTEAMKLLLQQPEANPSYGGYVAIRESLENDHMDIAMMLLRDERVHLEREPRSACILLCFAIQHPKVMIIKP